MKKLPDAATLSPDQLVERWTLWMKETQQEALHLYASRYAFENIQGMFRTNPDLAHTGSHVLNWLSRNFFVEYLISLRKEMEKGGDYMTLANFLLELEKYSEQVLTRTRYVALYDHSPLKEHGIPDRDFDQKCGAMCRFPRADASTDCISTDSVRGKREQLERDTEKAVKFANWFIAHRTRQKPFKMSFADMYKTLNRVFDTYAIYYNLITAGSWLGRFPTPQYDWFAPFQIPWICKDFKEFEPPQ